VNVITCPDICRTPGTLLIKKCWCYKGLHYRNVWNFDCEKGGRRDRERILL